MLKRTAESEITQDGSACRADEECNYLLTLCRAGHVHEYSWCEPHAWHGGSLAPPCSHTPSSVILILYPKHLVDRYRGGELPLKVGASHADRPPVGAYLVGAAVPYPLLRARRTSACCPAMHQPQKLGQVKRPPPVHITRFSPLPEYSGGGGSFIPLVGWDQEQ